MMPVLAPYDNPLDIYDPETGSLDSSKASFTLAPACMFNFDATSLTINGDGTIETFTPKKVLKHLRHHHQACVRIQPNKTATRKIVSCRCFVTANAEGATCDPVFIMKEPNLSEDALVELLVPGLSPHGDSGTGRIWLVKDLHGEPSIPVFRKYYNELILPFMEEKLNTLNETEVRRPGNPNKLPERALLQTDGERESLEIGLELLDRLIQLKIDLMKLGAGATAIQQIMDRSQAFRLLKMLINDTALRDRAASSLFGVKVEHLISGWKVEHAAAGHTISTKTWTAVRELCFRLRHVLPKALSSDGLVRPWEIAGVWPFNALTMLQQTKGIAAQIAQDCLEKIPQLLQNPKNFRITDDMLDAAGVFKTHVQAEDEKNSKKRRRDDKALNHQRNLLLTCKSFLVHQEQEKKKREDIVREKEEKERAKADRLRSKEEVATQRETNLEAYRQGIVERHQRRLLAERAELEAKAASEMEFPPSPITLLVNKLKAELPRAFHQADHPPKGDVRCHDCYFWWSRWMEATEELTVEVPEWGVCETCERWWCPNCRSFAQIKEHDELCQAFKLSEEERSHGRRKRRK